MGRMETVSVIIPCRNERRHLAGFLDSVLAQECPGLDAEILVADGMSDDGTRDLLAKYASKHPQIRVIDNPARFVSQGLNQAIRAARGAIILRMDAHTEYASDYLAQCVRTLSESGAANVGGPARTRARGYVQSAIRLAYHSPFACGGARFHDENYEGVVDTVTYGCWRRETLIDIGLFDEELVRNQDDELNLRLRRAGKVVWQSPSIRSWYYPRASLQALFQQYSQYGYWKVRVIQKHKLPASLRHLVPGGFVGALLAAGVLSPFWLPATWFFLGLIGIYLASTLAASLWTCRASHNWRYLPVMPAVYAAYHLGYGWGFLQGIMAFGLRFQRAGAGFSALTRQTD